MEAVNYLRQARKLEIMIRHKEKELKKLKHDAIGKDGKQMEHIVAKYVDMEEKLNADLCGLHSKRIEIMDTIHRVDDSLCMVILHAKWIDGESLEKIACETDYSFPYVRKKYTKGMKEVKKIINREKS